VYLFSDKEHLHRILLFFGFQFIHSGELYKQCAYMNILYDTCNAISKRKQIGLLQQLSFKNGLRIVKGETYHREYQPKRTRLRKMYTLEC